MKEACSFETSVKCYHFLRSCVASVFDVPQRRVIVFHSDRKNTNWAVEERLVNAVIAREWKRGSGLHPCGRFRAFMKNL